MREFRVENGLIIIEPTRKDAKPITGTKLGGITGDNPYQTPFLIFMDLYRFSTPFIMNIPVKLGMALEDAVVEKVNMETGMKFGAYDKTSSGFMAKYYDWNLDNAPGKYFNGLIDGWDKEKKIVLECKVSNIKNDKRDEFKQTGKDIAGKFSQHPPIYYLLQMMLYGFLSDAKEVWLSAYFIDDSDLAGIKLDTPDTSIVSGFKYNPEKLVIWKYKMDEAFKAKAKIKLDMATKFRNESINARIAPKANAGMKCDVELIQHLYKNREINLNEVTSLLDLDSPSLEKVFIGAGDPKWIPNNLKKYEQAKIDLQVNPEAMFNAICKLNWL